MKIKRLKSIRINSYTFSIKWDKSHSGGSFKYGDECSIEIGTEMANEGRIFDVLCHELMEICAVEMNVRFKKTDSMDYIFVYDHAQHDTKINMFAGLITQFIK